MNSRTLIGVVVLSFFLAIFAGCGEKSSVVAQMGNKVFTMKDLDERISKLPVEYQKIAKQNKKDILDSMVIEHLMVEEAKRRRINKNAEVVKLIEAANNKILVAKLVDDETSLAFVTDEEVEEFYQRHKEEFVAPERWRASHILVETEGDADVVLERLKSGEKFEDLAKEVSQDATKDRGGDIGYFTKGQILPSFEEVCIELEVDEISKPVKTPMGYHIIKLVEHSMPRELTLEEVKSRIEAELLAMKKKLSFEKLIDNLKKKSNVKINEELLGQPKQVQKQKQAEEGVTQAQ